MEEVNFVKALKYRPIILKSLDKQIRMPSQLAKDFGVPTCQISNILKSLRSMS